MITRRQPAIAIFSILCAQAALADEIKWSELKVTIQDQGLPLTQRISACHTASKAADAAIAADFLSIAESWSQRLAASRLSIEDMTRDKRIAATSRLLSSFVTHDLALLEPQIKDKSNLLDFLVEVVTKAFCANEAKDAAVRQIDKSSAPPELKRQALLAIISDASIRKNSELSPSILEAVDEDMFLALRRSVGDSQDPKTFHFAAAAILAHYGDAATRAELEKLVPKFQEEDRNLGGILTYYLWQIDVQNPPTRLLDFIAEPSPPEVSVEKRLWAIRRAVELRLEKSKIREAVLKHANLVQPDKKTGIRRGLSSLKKLCLELKVLEQSDLPDVRVTKATFTP